MLNKVRGIVLRRVPYGDSNLIITFLAEHGRKIAVMARNARKSKKFGSSLDLFYENLFIFSQFKGMGSLTSVDTLNSHYDLRTDIYKLTYAQYIAELIDRALEEDEENKQCYQLLKFGLDNMAADHQPAVIALMISLKVMPLYGYKPNFYMSEVDQSTDAQSFTAYSFKYNSVITTAQLESDPHAVRMSNRSLYLLNLLGELPLEQFSHISIQEATVKEMERLIFKLYDEFTGVYLKSRKILEQL
ncbi:DNA repair protein RecO [Macrococcus hajekii]|uniref:DNA repair protein RecO n=1 Tax=Macrococcus hajekii TaxID=198482 RepID=A0A4R6BM40_9STAP|nr:DNA repair protein RecO [Macrococcus hajekii]TDM02884.1 DNA repair protein RecO [Macrococcus hajekii]GGB04640.1 DNA repair protein RecO [Macrococcus hajekii]